MKVNGKVIVVTGAGSGMGREITLELVRRGAKVAAVDFRKETLDETVALATAIGGTVSPHTLDVSDLAKVAALPTQIEEALGAVDGLINNAGIIQPFVHVSELEWKDVEHVMAVNFFGPVALVKAFLPGLKKRSDAHILNVSSMGAYAPVPGQTVYGASKAAIKLFTEGLRSELLETKVGVTVVFPGAIATNIAANSGMANMTAESADASKFKQTPAPAAAKAMVDAIESNNPRITIGSDATMMDRLSRLNPVMAANIIYKQMKSLLS
ncbi:MAG: SDR family NAD(P)-dependent oxidoreductase [Microbacteriaceae bacterium]